MININISNISSIDYNMYLDKINHTKQNIDNEKKS